MKLTLAFRLLLRNYEDPFLPETPPYIKCYNSPTLSSFNG